MDESLLTKILTYGDKERVALLKDLWKSDDLELVQEAFEAFLKTAAEPWDQRSTFAVHRLAVALSYNHHTTTEQLMAIVCHRDVGVDLRLNLIRYAGSHNEDFLRALVEADDLPPLMLEQEVFDIVMSSAAIPFDLCERIMARPNVSMRQRLSYMQHHAIPIDKFMDFRVPADLLLTELGRFTQEDWEEHCTYRQEEVTDWMHKNKPELLDLPFDWACKVVAGMKPVSVA